MYTRHHKLEWLKETCSSEFLQNSLINELVRWMTEEEFEAFYAHLCSAWDIKRDPNDPNWDPEVDNMEAE